MVYKKTASVRYYIGIVEEEEEEEGRGRGGANVYLLLRFSCVPRLNPLSCSRYDCRSIKRARLDARSEMHNYEFFARDPMEGTDMSANEECY
jgi:hypothetical protein